MQVSIVLRSSLLFLALAVTVPSTTFAAQNALFANIVPLTSQVWQALSGTDSFNPHLFAVSDTQVRSWLDTLTTLQDSATGHVDFNSTSCAYGAACNKALEVSVLEWARNNISDPTQPIDCNAYLLVAATTPVPGSNDWDQAFNPRAEFLIRSLNGSAEKTACSWTVQHTLQTIELVDKPTSTGRKLHSCHKCKCGCDALTNTCQQCSCFSGRATVQSENGMVLRMDKLNVGDKVAVVGRDGQLAYDHVYAFGHQDRTAVADFITLDLRGSTEQIQLTSGHFIPVAVGPSAARVFKRARDVAIGDRVWATNATAHDGMHLSEVAGISIQKDTGLYNPLTLGGTIVVDGVAASVHSEWFLDSVADSFGMASHLPPVYQAMLFPARLIWYVLGKQNYIWLYNVLDKQLGGLDRFGTKYGAEMSFIGLTVTGISFAILPVTLLSFVTSPRKISKV